MERLEGGDGGRWDGLHLGERHDWCPPATCAHVEPLLSALVDGELPPAERDCVADHLGSCPACRRTLAVFRAFDAGLAAALPATARRPVGADACPVCARPVVPGSQPPV